MDSVYRVLSECISSAVRDVGPKHGVKNVDAFVSDVMSRLYPMPPPPASIRAEDRSRAVIETVNASDESSEKKSVDESSEKKSVDESSEKKSRARTVSKKMKESFAQMGGSEEQLKEVTKKYKDASDEEIALVGGTFDGFARSFLGTAAPPAASEKAPVKKAHVKKARARITWTPTPKKIFKEVIEGSGGTYSDEMQIEFSAVLDAMSESDYKALSVEGHMRAFAVSKYAPPSPVLARSFATMGEPDEEEDLEEFNFEDETLMIGIKSGKIYRTTEDAGDVLIGVAGRGRFADVKLP